MTDITYRLPQQRRLLTELPGPRSAELIERRSRAVSAAVTSSVPVYAADADGGVIVDVDGNSLIDLGSGIAVTTVGAANPAVAAAAAAQAERFIHTCFMVTPYEGYVSLAERLNELTPGDGPKRTALFNSGAEAVENAIKIARAATGRDAVVCFDHAYHGRTNLTMALTSRTVPYKHSFGPFAPEIYRMPMSYPYRDRFGEDGAAAADAVIALMESQIGADALAALIIEPIQGEGGFIVPAPGFLPALSAWCTAHGVVFIADEVQSGFARTGGWFASEAEGVVPDLMTMAKGIAGGLPLAAVTGRAELMDAVHPAGLGGTYGGNPVACAGALAAIDEMERLDLPGRAREFEQIITDRLHTLAADLAAADRPVIGEIRGRGGMIAVELVTAESARTGGREPNPDLARTAARAALERGLVILTCGTYGNNIRLLPPLVMPDHLLREALDILADVLTTHA